MTRVWACDDQSPLRQYTSRGPPYNSQDRYLPGAHQDGYRHSVRRRGLAHESSRDDQESEDSKSTRRRIPVACGRCRKRKIRCTGPQGESGCQNCKNAGNSDCQFNRVQSDEVFLKDNTTDFTYNTEIARTVQCRGVSHSGLYRPQTPSYAHTHGVPINYTYRNLPLSDYHYDPKSACYMPPYSAEYPEEASDYTLSTSTYPLYSQENINTSSGYASNSTNRAWNLPTQPVRNPLYIDAEPEYAQPQVQYRNSAVYGMHPTVSVEPSNFSFSGIASSLPLPMPIMSNDRVLPMPSGPRNIIGLAPPRSADAAPHSDQSPKFNSHAIPGTQLITAVNSEIVSYAPHSSSSTSTDPYSFSSNSNSSGSFPSNVGQQHQETYAAGESWSSPPLKALSTAEARLQECSSDQYYNQIRDSPRKASQSGQSSQSSASANTGTVSSSQTSRSSYEQQEITHAQISRNNNFADLSRVASHHPSNSSLRGA